MIAGQVRASPRPVIGGPQVRASPMPHVLGQIKAGNSAVPVNIPLQPASGSHMR